MIRFLPPEILQRAKWEHHGLLPKFGWKGNQKSAHQCFQEGREGQANQLSHPREQRRTFTHQLVPRIHHAEALCWPKAVWHVVMHAGSQRTSGPAADWVVDQEVWWEVHMQHRLQVSLSNTNNIYYFLNSVITKIYILRENRINRFKLKILVLKGKKNNQILICSNFETWMHFGFHWLKWDIFFVSFSNETPSLVHKLLS